MNQNIKSMEIRIQGMDCSECTAHVDRAIRSVPDVYDVQVFLGAEKAKIAFQENTPDLKLIRQAVRDAGYEVILDPGEQQVDIASEKEKETSNRLKKVLLIVFGLVLFVAVFGEWLGIFEQVTDLIPWFVWLAMIVVGGWPIFQNVARSALKRTGDFSLTDDSGRNCGNRSKRMAYGCCGCAFYACGRLC